MQIVNTSNSGIFAKVALRKLFDHYCISYCYFIFQHTSFFHENTQQDCNTVKIFQR